MTKRHLGTSLLRGALLASALWTSGAPVVAQTLTTGDISGVVSDASGAVVPNAGIELRNADNGDVRKVTTSGAGQYPFFLLTPGSYTLTASAPGLKSGVQKMSVPVGENLELNIALSVEGTKAVIEVSTEAAVLQTENANLTRAFNTQLVADLPMSGGDLTTLAMTIPGVRVNVKGGSGNMNANGVPGASMMFTLNGADIMDPYNNLNNPGASNNTLGANEVAEVAVILNAFSAQYGRMAGGQDDHGQYALFHSLTVCDVRHPEGLREFRAEYVSRRRLYRRGRAGD